MTISKFREIIVQDLLFGKRFAASNEEPGTPAVTRKALKNHIFFKKEGAAAIVRKYCRGCYEKKVRGEIQKNHVKKVTTYCMDCEDDPHFCLPCFNRKHQKV